MHQSSSEMPFCAFFKYHMNIIASYQGIASKSKVITPGISKEKCKMFAFQLLYMQPHSQSPHFEPYGSVCYGNVATAMQTEGSSAKHGAQVHLCFIIPRFHRLIK